MLRNVLDDWVNSLTERDFDEPFMVLLRAHGFYDIHFTHGPYEYGKDFIAKRVVGESVEQWGFQSKAGNVSGGLWQMLLGQLEELVDGWLAHPNFDSSATRIHCLAITGRLRGKAILGARAWKEKLAARGDGAFEVWDQEGLLDLLEGVAPNYRLVETTERAQKLIASAVADSVSWRSLNAELSLVWGATLDTTDFWRSCLDVTMLAAVFAATGRRLHAVRAVQHLVRLTLCAAMEKLVSQDYVETMLNYAADYGLDAVESLLDLSARDLSYRSGPSFAGWAAYPATCQAVMGVIGVSILRCIDVGDVGLAEQLGVRLERFVGAQPGCMHPFSDADAANMVVTVAALKATGQHQAVDLVIVNTARWICDRIEDDMGLCGPYSSEKEEVYRVLAAHFDFTEVERRQQSQYFVALAECCQFFAPHLYGDVLNDLWAVGASGGTVYCGFVSEAVFGVAQGTGRTLVNLSFPETVPAEILPHQRVPAEGRELQFGRMAGAGIVSIMCQDRLLSDVWAAVQPLDSAIVACL